MKRRFWHYTAPLDSHLGSIMVTGMIRTTESNAFGDREHGAPPVVWLLDRPHLMGEDHGLLYHRPVAGLPADIKTKAEIIVSLPAADAFLWTDWIRTQPHDPDWVDTLIRAGGGPDEAAHWWVTTRPVRKAEFLSVRNRVTGVKIAVNPLTGVLS